MAKFITVLLIGLSVIALSACSVNTSNMGVAIVEISEQPSNASIQLQGDSISVEGSGVVIDGQLATITTAGSYEISGMLDNGQIVVDALDTDIVELILNGIDITYQNGAPIYVRNAKTTVINLKSDTVNLITDGVEYEFEDLTSNEPNATIFSKDDLIIAGDGSLVVTANFENGIQSKDDLIISGGSIEVEAVADGIKGRDSITIQGGNIQISAGADGLQSNNNEERDKGEILIEGGTIHIASGLDGIQAETYLMIEDGDISIVTGGGSSNAPIQVDKGMQGMRMPPTDGRFPIQGMPPPSGDAFPNNPPIEGPTERALQNENEITSSLTADESAESAKGLKAGLDITISGGAINIDSLDDALNSNDTIKFRGGEILIKSGDDGIHADTELEIDGGTITIEKAYEGIESASLIINNGQIHVISDDDGFNAAGGRDNSSMGGLFGQDEFNPIGEYGLEINGGSIYIDAQGDGIDINGSIEMNDGFVIINGPTMDNNSAIDFTGSFNINGGELIAVGSSGMAEMPSDTSAQFSVMHNFQSIQPAKTLVHIESQNGDEIFTFQPTKAYQSLLFSSSKLEKNMTYTIFTGGSENGEAINGLFSDGLYTPGSKVASYTITSVITGESIRDGFRGGPGWGGDG